MSRLTRNEKVAGSIPAGGPSKTAYKPEKPCKCGPIGKRNNSHRIPPNVNVLGLH